MDDTSTVLLRLTGPVQAWGTPGAHWEHRPTLHRPTKSGVLGMVANAMGRTRDESREDLATLRFGVRADRPGHIEPDYQTAGGGRFPLDSGTVFNHPELGTNPDQFHYGAPRDPHPTTGKPGWSEKARQTVVKRVGLLVDASFVVALTGPTALTEPVWDAVTNPARLLCLGRHGCYPTEQVAHRHLTGPDHEHWHDATPLLPEHTTSAPHTWIETGYGTGELVYENPGAGRNFTPCFLTHTTTTPPQGEHPS